VRIENERTVGNFQFPYHVSAISFDDESLLSFKYEPDVNVIKLLHALDK
jgi:hypothetical protein